jgi:hypothetical protein
MNDLAKGARNSTDWAKIREHARSNERPPEWREDIQAISINGLALLGIDRKNRLYWDGKRIATLTLTTWQKLGAFLITVSAAVGAVAAITSARADVGPQPGRFQVMDIGGEILRVDTATGEARECMITEEKKTLCKVVFDRDGIFAPETR